MFKQIKIFDREIAAESCFIFAQKVLSYRSLNSPPPGQNCRHFAEDVFRCIFVNERFCILIKFSPKFAPKGPIDNNLPDNKVDGVHMGPIWGRQDPWWAPCWPHELCYLG